jgi:uncharacterized protein (TIGR00369 family)
MTTILENAQKMLRGEVPPPPVGRLIGFELIAVEPGHATCTLDAGEQHHNPMGTLHGGILCDIADVAMGLAYGSTLDEGETFTTLELKINFLRPVKNARLVADGVVVQRGRTIGMAECSIIDERGRLIAKATSTCLTLRGEQARGR